MKHLLILICLLSSSFFTLAGEDVDREVDAASDGHVKIEHLNGRAIVRAWEKDKVRVVGELGDRTEEFIFRRNGNTVTIKVEVAKQRNRWNNWSSSDGDDLEIFIPKTSSVYYSSTNADVELREFTGGADIEVVNGKIEASNLSGKLRFSTVNGNIDGDDLHGTVVFNTVNGNIDHRSANTTSDSYETVNGNIRAATHSAEVSAETVNGDIDLHLRSMDEVQLNTVNGRIEAKMSLNKNADVRASSVGGTISLYFDHDVSARFDIEAHAGGRITNSLSKHRPEKAKYGPASWLEFSLNRGDAKVDISTVSGRIKLATK